MTTGQPTMPDPSEQTTGRQDHLDGCRCALEERNRIAQEIRNQIPPPWGGQADYWKAWWDVADAVEANFFESEEPQPEETPAHG